MAADRPLGRILWYVFLTVLLLALAVLLVGLVYRVIEPPAPSAERVDNPAELIGEVLQIQVLNGAGQPGAARTVTEYLRSRGFDVVEHGNRHPFDVDDTHVIDRVGSHSAAMRVARSLGLGESAVVEDIDPRFYVDVTVVIGRDFQQLRAFTN